MELNPTLRTLLDELVLPAIQNLQAPIRKSAVAAMGVCLLRNIELASHHLPLLFQIAHLDEIDVRVSALSMVYDLLMRFGLQAFVSNAGMNCIKIGLPGKSILGDYFRENRTSRRPFLLGGLGWVVFPG